MTGIRQPLPLAFSDTSLPKLITDPMINAGTLMLIDPTLDGASWAAGVPTANGYVPNIATKTAHALLGSDVAEVRGQWKVGTNQAPANSIFERTTKGGLHGIVSKVSTGAGKGAALTHPSAILAYLLTNKTHQFYASLWYNVTRTSGGASDGTSPTFSYVGDPTGGMFTNYIYALRSRISRPKNDTSPAYLGARPGFSAQDTAGEALRNIGSGGLVGSTPASLLGAIATWGKPGVDATSESVLDAANMPSWAMYRYTLEDLTVSGRSYATADAADLALFTAAVSTGGGRYNGDTFTNPTALA